MGRSGSQLTDKQLMLMDILWKTESPMTSLEIAPFLPDWSATSLSNMINLLIDKGLIRITSIEVIDGHYIRRLLPTCTREEYAAKLVTSLHLKRESFSRIITALAEELSADDYEGVVSELEDIISDFNSRKGSS